MRGSEHPESEVIGKKKAATVVMTTDMVQATISVPFNRPGRYPAGLWVRD